MIKNTTPTDCIKFDMHVHSAHSNDSVVHVSSILDAWFRRGVLSLVCDHNTTRGAEEVYTQLKRRDPDIPYLLSEEIMTSEGEIIGTFLTEEIPRDLSPEETLDIIQDQGGISIVPHPFCRYRPTAITPDALGRVIERIDIVEGYNARNISPEYDARAQECGRWYKKPLSAGSDAHLTFELCRNYTIIEPFSTPKELIANLQSPPVHFKRTSAVAHSISRMVRATRSNGQKPHSSPYIPATE